jgi:hypothetical protein
MPSIVPPRTPPPTGVINTADDTIPCVQSPAKRHRHGSIQPNGLNDQNRGKADCDAKADTHLCIPSSRATMKIILQTQECLSKFGVASVSMRYLLGIGAIPDRHRCDTGSLESGYND